MTTLIVGCGYLGRRVGRRLRERGERVVGTVRSAGHAEELAANWDIEPLLADVLDPASLNALPASDRVLYCVGFDRSSGQSRRAVVVEGLRQVLDRLEGRTDRLVFASTTGVYAQDDGSWVDEDAPTEPRHESGQVALEAEGLVRFFKTRTGPPVLLRFAGLYGPGRIIRREPLLSRRADRGRPRPLPQPHPHRRRRPRRRGGPVAGRGPGGIVNVADDRPEPRSRYYEIAASLIGGPPPRFVRPETRPANGASRTVGSRTVGMKEALRMRLLYPTIEVGLPAALAAEDSDAGTTSR